MYMHVSVYNIGLYVCVFLHKSCGAVGAAFCGLCRLNLVVHSLSIWFHSCRCHCLLALCACVCVCGVYSFLIKTNSADSLRRTWQVKLNYFVVFCATVVLALCRDLDANALSFLACRWQEYVEQHSRGRESCGRKGVLAAPFDGPVRATAPTESAALFVIL